MGSKDKEQIYKTAPFKVWNKAKEIRNRIYQEVIEAKDKGKLLIGGGAESLITLASGFDHAFLTGEPYGASVAHLYSEDPKLYMEIVEACEHKGFPRDLCAYMRNYIGSMLVDKFIFGRGPFPKIDVCLQAGFCDTHYKWYQAVSEIRGVPFYSLDLVPLNWETSGESEEIKRLKHEFIYNQILEAIEWMEKVTGRKYNDEKFIQGVYNECESTSLWAKCCVLNRNIPAPMDEKTMLSFYVLAVLGRYRDDVVEFYRELLAELEEELQIRSLLFLMKRHV